MLSAYAVSILCRDCRTIRWADLDIPHPGLEKFKAANLLEYA